MGKCSIIVNIPLIFYLTVYTDDMLLFTNKVKCLKPSTKSCFFLIWNFLAMNTNFTYILHPSVKPFKVGQFSSAIFPSGFQSSICSSVVKILIDKDNLCSTMKIKKVNIFIIWHYSFYYCITFVINGWKLLEFIFMFVFNSSRWMSVNI